MTNSIRLLINIAEIEQLGFVVRDINKSMKYMWHKFGIGPWNIIIRNPDSHSEMTYHSRPARFSFKLAYTQNKLGGVEIELIEPTEGESDYRDFLKEHGEGLHHLGWYKVDSLKSFRETIIKLEKNGYSCLMSMVAKDFSIAAAYIDTRKTLNTILEVLWRDS